MTAAVRSFDGVAAFRSSMPASHLEESSAESNFYDSASGLSGRSVVSTLVDQAEQQMDWLKARINYLERRAASTVGATERELEDLMRARDELAWSAARVAHLSSLFELPESEKYDAALDWDGWNEY